MRTLTPIKVDVQAVYMFVLVVAAKIASLSEDVKRDLPNHDHEGFGDYAAAMMQAHLLWLSSAPFSTT